MSYAEITFRDRNPIKRWLQRQRLVSALALYGSRHPQVICDYGAGSGELCKLLAVRYPDAKIICYEPTSELLREATQNLAAVPNVDFRQEIGDVEVGTVDAVFCLEVFEHLPDAETLEALARISRLLRPSGHAVIGVPVEIGIPALYKGAFRMARRYGAFDATLKNVSLAFIGIPPNERPIAEIGPGLRFHHFHAGFDFRRFRKTLEEHLKLHEAAASPISQLGPWLMPEINFLAEKR